MKLSSGTWCVEGEETLRAAEGGWGAQDRHRLEENCSSMGLELPGKKKPRSAV